MDDFWENIEKKFYLNVPFNEKDLAKELGAKWDNTVKKWYYISDKEDPKFEKWQNSEKINKIFPFENLSEEQKDFINLVKTGKNVLVDACIGSGKTTTIQVLCNELQNQRILYLTYNTLLKIDAQSKIKSGNTTVTNYHGFAFSVLNKYNIKTGIANLIQEFNRRSLPIGHFDLLVIDEYQDIDLEISIMLEHIKNCNPNIQIVAVGDMKQKIYDKTSLDVEYFMPRFLGDYDLIQFTKCFRINKNYANKLGLAWEKTINGVNENCQVEYIKFNDSIDILSKLKPEQIIALGSRYNDLSSALNILESKYNDKFNKFTVYASITDDDRNAKPTAENAIFTTYDSSKGMEREYCFVYDFTFSYYETRASKSSVDLGILRNVFLVAASRGKRKIYFVEPLKKEKILLTNLSLIKATGKLDFNFGQVMNPVDMFNFKYKEDVENCYSLLKVEEISSNDTSFIDVKSTDGLIDLSPCIGIFQEASFFKNFDLAEQIRFENKTFTDKKYIAIDEKDTLEQLILKVVARDTKQDRYIKQVKLPFISNFIANMIHNRLREEFTGYEKVQIPARTKIGPLIISGRIDVIKDNIPYELKFINSLNHEHYLQLATYLYCNDMEFGIIWNVKSNKKYRVSITDRKMFKENVFKCVTKGLEYNKYKHIKPTTNNKYVSKTLEEGVF